MIITQLFLKARASTAVLASLGAAGTENVNNHVLYANPNKTIAAGTLLIVSALTGGYGQVVTLSDTKGNTWTKAGEMETLTLWYSKITTELTVSDTINMSTPGTSSKSISMWQFNIPSGQNPYHETAVTASNGSFNATPSMSMSGLTSRTYLFVRTVGMSNSGYTVNDITPTSGFTLLTADTLYNASAIDHIFNRGEFIISTGTGITSNPGDNFSNTASKNILAAIYLAP